ncbi:MAG TPA: SpoIID/LytB domain-containing protein [Pyrinomonadaceae bacterium]|nr:SpoIID/LytB domain-containing protein [Pyrinomonadaceae bacterium]
MDLAPKLTEMLAKSINISPSGSLCLVGVIAVVSVYALFSPHRTSFPANSPGAITAPTAAEVDLALQRAAAAALGEHEGTVIVMNPQSGRLRTVINPTIAFESKYTPGSTIKPFVTLAALQSGLITKNSRLLCREHYSNQDFSTVCAHPRNLPALDPSAAIAYSCNYYFGRLGEKLGESTLSSVLASFGFGRTTGAGVARESVGTLVSGKHDPRNSLGESESFQSTPIQLLTAYSTLVNGGKLLTPHLGGDEQTSLRAKLNIAPTHRELIINGMRGAVINGSARRVQLSSLPIQVFGKTGTAAQPDEFRTHGWFVGFAADDQTMSPESIVLAVLVFLKRANGAQAAEAAGVVLAEYARWAGATRASEVTRNQPDDVEGSTANNTVRVHLVRENLTHTLSLEDYVLGVVTAEGSTENEPEALKALAVAARTYAVRNLGRHRPEGFDFCSTTHCQRFVISTSGRVFQPREAVLAAVRSTQGLVLLENTGQVADSYFSASCGGMTADVQRLWGGKPVAYLHGVVDDYCATGPHYEWTDVISNTELATALSGDSRTDVGKTIRKLSILKRDATGRVELIALEGDGHRTVSGWDLKIIVGRKLGWHLLKSSRFDVECNGAGFVFHGTGFGHGLGLCQEGAHVMAGRGATYTAILAKYFPGLEVGVRGWREREMGNASADLLWTNRAGRQDALLLAGHDLFLSSSPSSSRNVLSSEHFRLSFPRSLSRAEAEKVLKSLESGRKQLLARLTTAGVEVQLPLLELYVNETTGEFTARTGQPWWSAAATNGKRIELQPVQLLRRRGVLDTTLRHELAHVAIDVIAEGSAPRWLAEGLALFIAGEGPLVARYADGRNLSNTELEVQLSGSRGREELRAAYAAAYNAVSRLILAEGEVSVWRRVAQYRRTPKRKTT